MGIKFKRQGGGSSNSNVAAAPTSLNYGEPAIDSAGNLYVGNGSGKVVSRVKNAERSNFDMPLYRASLSVTGWSGSAEDGFTQEAVASPQGGAPDLTADMQLGVPMTLPTGVKNTDELLQETLTILNLGTSTPGAGKVTAKVWEKPTTDIAVYYYAR